MKLLLSHIADPDGITPVILLNLTDELFDYELFEVDGLSDFINERIDSDYFLKYDQVFIVDLGITKECAINILNSKYHDKFKLFDHHESHEFLNEFDFALVVEEHDGFKECGTSLFYNYLKEKYDVLNKNSIVTFTELVRENDTWQFTKDKKKSMELANLFEFYGKDTFIEKYTKYLKNNAEFDFDSLEQEILKCLDKNLNDYLEFQKDKVIFKNIKGYNIGIVFAERYRSELGDYLANLYQDKIDFVAIININKHVSLRGKKLDKPVNKFAESYQGGGHPMASAMPYPSDLKEKIIDYIFGDKNGDK